MTVRNKMHISVLFGIIVLTLGFQIVVGGVHEPFFAEARLTFPISSEDAKPGYLIGKTFARDLDNEPLTYTLESSKGNKVKYFTSRYDGTNLGIYVKKTLPSDQQVFTFYVKAEDKDQNKAYQFIEINIS